MSLAKSMDNSISAAHPDAVSLRYCEGMTIEAIKDAILALPEADRLEIEHWLADRWDSQIDTDFSLGGRGTAILEQVDAEIEAGNFHPMDRRR